MSDQYEKAKAKYQQLKDYWWSINPFTSDWNEEPYDQGDMDFDEWITVGIQQGFCSEQFCMTHAGPILTDKELEAWDEGIDPCHHVVRLGSPVDWDNDLYQP